MLFYVLFHIIYIYCTFKETKMIKEIQKLPYFTLENMNTFIDNKNTAKVYISRWIKWNKILSIKRWYYVSVNKINEIHFNNNFSLYIEYLATNILYTPSYLSLDYVLFKNNIITENVYNITLISTKKTTKFKNNFWSFVYRNIKNELFWWYKLFKKWELFFFEAEVEKALLDYFWYKKDIVWEEDYFINLRLNLNLINFNKLNKMWNKFGSNKINKVITFLTNIKW